MPMNLIIQEKRKELGLTQEEVAQFLNVSAPAVSKWEKGITCPDISLLPSLARLLKTDLNALFCFREDLTLEEISLFCKEIIQTAQTDGILSAFDTAVQKIQEYPHNETLLHYMALNLDGLLSMSCLPEESTQAMEKQIVSWYQRLAQSSDPKISNSAKYMLVSRHIRKSVQRDHCRIYRERSGCRTGHRAGVQQVRLQKQGNGQQPQWAQQQDPSTNLGMVSEQGRFTVAQGIQFQLVGLHQVPQLFE